MKNLEEEKIEEILKEAGEQEEIPESLNPEHMKAFLEENAGQKKKKNVYRWYKMAAAAASLVLILAVGRAAWTIQEKAGEDEAEKAAEELAETQEEACEETETAVDEYDTSYNELYAFFKKNERQYWERIKSESKESVIEDSDIAYEESATSEFESNVSGQPGSESADYADTNKQEEGVDEADIVKNDGRYLYQVIENTDYFQAVQIVDTKDGLKEIAKIDDFDNILELYVWKDKLVVFESCWAEAPVDEAEEEEREQEDVVYADYAGAGTAFQKVYIYDISDRANPKEEHMFTMKGHYLDSRLVDGYLYCFLTYDVENLESKREYERYVPVLEDKAMEASSIYLPKEAQTSSYVVIASVDLENPKELKDTKAIVSSADRVYVTTSNIYVADSVYSQETEEKGWYSNKTNLLRFSYENGMIHKEAEGSVKGALLDDMAINEYNGYLRMAVTVNSYKKERVIDDILEDFLGYETTNTTQDNSLYVLNQDLEVVGKIEGLAEDEKIYSARFMGDTGYFVTFRQTDPLFSVDLSEPENPKVLGELKISGFSEYLHFYDENLLLGIGMEADEETGRTEGMKLSMFDISNPADVTEQDKYSLSEYDYSDGLYNYKAVMIDTKKNLFGFYAEGWNEGDTEDYFVEDYLLFSYENGAFQQKLKISCEGSKDGFYTRVRGTYIGDVFYLMYSDGRIEAYSLSDGSLLEKIGE